MRINVGAFPVAICLCACIAVLANDNATPLRDQNNVDTVLLKSDTLNDPNIRIKRQNGGRRNQGNSNQGTGNQGNSNQGSGNQGTGNQGNNREGNGNQDTGNSGNGNSGNGNAGNGNSGNGNPGNGNGSGSGNSNKILLPSNFSDVFRDLVREAVLEIANQPRNDSEDIPAPVRRLREFLSSASGENTPTTALAHIRALHEIQKEIEEQTGQKIKISDLLAAVVEELQNIITIVDDETGETTTIAEFNGTTVETVTRLPDQEVTEAPGVCQIVRMDCSYLRQYPYRTFDGTCNNMNKGNELWGSANRAFKRRVPADYADGIFAPRESSTSTPLPSARDVSMEINFLSGISPFDTVARMSPINSLLIMQIGQFIDHDLTLTKGQSASCPGCGEVTNPYEVLEECLTCSFTSDTCFNIPLEFGHGLGRCISFVRSAPVLADNCDFSHIEQGNVLTAWIDASQVYGSSLTEAQALRDHTPVGVFGREHGRLLIRNNPVGTLRDKLLPANPQACNRGSDITCFLAGDVRVNEQPGLTSMHTIFVRLHNLFEEGLHQQNQNWDGEKLFQETRRLVIAVWQHIVVDEYLAVILGRTAYDNSGLGSNNYNRSVNPDIANEFATAAFRFGHTHIPDTLPFDDFSHIMRFDRQLHDSFLNPTDIYQCPISMVSGVDSIMSGMSDVPSERFDSFFAETIRERLFNGGGFGPGLDLPALNIQRGRDHGIPGYGHILKWCGLPVTTSHLRPNMVQGLLSLYGGSTATANETLYNMDLFAAGVSETPVPDGQLGPTFTCLVSRQFEELKSGDRFYFRHQNGNDGFTNDQKANIVTYGLASVLCDTLANFTTVQDFPLLKPWVGNLTPSIDPGLFAFYGPIRNERRSCSQIPKIGFTLFKKGGNGNGQG